MNKHMTENEKRFTVTKIEKYNKEKNSAETKAFITAFGAGVFTIGTVLSFMYGGLELPADVTVGLNIVHRVVSGFTHSLMGVPAIFCFKNMISNTLRAVGLENKIRDLEYLVDMEQNNQEELSKGRIK